MIRHWHFLILTFCWILALFTPGITSAASCPSMLHDRQKHLHDLMEILGTGGPGSAPREMHGILFDLRTALERSWKNDFFRRKDLADIGERCIQPLSGAYPQFIVSGGIRNPSNKIVLISQKLDPKFDNLPLSDRVKIIEIGTLPEAVTGQVVTVVPSDGVSSKVILTGGKTVHGRLLDGIYLVDLRTNQVTQVGRMSVGRANHNVSFRGGGLLIGDEIIRPFPSTEFWKLPDFGPAKEKPRNYGPKQL